jgi:hypothetical protein
MTTIAVNSEGMASDSGLMHNGVVSAVHAKKIFRIKGHLIGVCGRCADYEEYLFDLKKAKEDPIKYLTDVSETSYDCGSLILAPDGIIWRFDGATGIPYKHCESYAATGSGSPEALAAMMAGADPKGAIKIAIAMDPKTNGRVRYVKL